MSRRASICMRTISPSVVVTLPPCFFILFFIYLTFEVYFFCGTRISLGPELVARESTFGSWCEICQSLQLLVLLPSLPSLSHQSPTVFHTYGKLHVSPYHLLNPSKIRHGGSLLALSGKYPLSVWLCGLVIGVMHYKK